MSINEYYYSTSDLCLASTINVFFPLDSIDKRNATKALFLFKETPELIETIELFWQGKLSIEPQMFFQKIKYLKTRIYENR